MALLCIVPTTVPRTALQMTNRATREEFEASAPVPTSPLASTAGKRAVSGWAWAIWLCDTVGGLVYYFGYVMCVCAHRTRTAIHVLRVATAQRHDAWGAEGCGLISG